MSPEPQLHTLLKKLVVPPQDLASLTFCAGNKEAQVKQWLQGLPLTQIQYVSGMFYNALPEIGRLKITPEQRLAILELLRNPVHQCLEGLAQRYLNQPLILPEAALKTATIAQAIQKHLLNAYLVAVHDVCGEAKKDLQPLQSLAIHRALTSLGLLLLRSYQLYIPVSAQMWTDIHNLYELACALEVQHLLVDDRLTHQQGTKTAYLVYVRILLLATARPNQLRQEELDTTYKALDTFTHFAELESYDPKGKENLFVVLAGSNRAPFYKSHLPPNTNSEQILELRTNRLVARLQEQQPASPGETPDGNHNSLRNELNLSPAVTQHLIQAWNHLSLRSFERQEVHADIEITVGLTNIHFHLTDEQPFNLFLNQTHKVTDITGKDVIFQKRGAQLKDTKANTENDPWGDAFDIKGTLLDGKALSTLNIEKHIRAQEKENYHGQHPIHTVPLLDRSPGGYGIEWRDAIPAQVKAGELLGLREYGRTRWSIGVVRWAHQIKGATQLGIQILAPQAVPVGIAIVHKTGGFSEYLRALQIPELKAINQPASLITNAISFHEYNKARLYAQPPKGVAYEGDRTVQLTHRLFATGAFSQFGFRELLTAKPQTAAKDDFDSVWE